MLFTMEYSCFNQICLVFVAYNKVKICHNNIFKYVCQMTGWGSISQQFVLNVPNFDVTRHRFTLSLHKRSIFSENDVINIT